MLSIFFLSALPIQAKKLHGLYKSELGLLRLVEHDGMVTAKVVKSQCGLKKGTIVIDAMRLDETLSGEVRSCVITAECRKKSPSIKGLAMLLISKKGHSVKGGVHFDSKCETPLKAHALVLTKVKRKVKNKNRKKNLSAVARKLKLEENQQLAEELMKKAALFLGAGQAEDARAKFEKVIALKVGSSQAYNGLGVTYYMRQRFDEALSAYQTALEIDPMNHDVYYNLACIYAILGEKNKAISFLEIALLNGYIDLKTMQADQDLNNIREEERYKKLLDGNILSL